MIETLASIAAAVISGLNLWILSSLDKRVSRLEDIFLSARGREISEIVGGRHA